METTIVQESCSGIIDQSRTVVAMASSGEPIYKDELLSKTKHGLITKDKRVYLVVENDVYVKPVTSQDDLYYDGKNYHCPLCKNFFNKRHIKKGDLICAKCKGVLLRLKPHLPMYEHVVPFEDTTIQESVTNTYEQEVELPNGTRCVLTSEMEMEYYEDEIEEWIESDKIDSYADKGTLSRLILCNLEIMRIQARLSDKRTQQDEKKSLQDSLRMMNREVTELTKELTGRDEKDSSAMHVVNRTIKECAEYRKSNRLLFEGIYQCKSCKKVVVVKSDFQTFEKSLLKQLKDIDSKIQLTLKDKYDFLTADTIYNELYEYLKEMSPENYTTVIEKDVRKIFK